MGYFWLSFVVFDGQANERGERFEGITKWVFVSLSSSKYVVTVVLNLRLDFGFDLFKMILLNTQNVC